MRFWGHCRCCAVRAEENQRLWALIQSMRAVTIEPQAHPLPVIVKAADRRVEVDVPRPTEQEREAGMRSPTRVIYEVVEDDEESDGRAG